MQGVYKITNIINGKFYIGISNDIERRFKDHKASAKSGSLQRMYVEMRDYGIQNFKFEVLEIINDEKVRMFMEKYYYITLRPEYNNQVPSDGGIDINESLFEVSESLSSMSIYLHNIYLEGDLLTW
jgi:group I intron endonuclease